jgi:hypothetical protein
MSAADLAIVGLIGKIGKKVADNGDKWRGME